MTLGTRVVFDGLPPVGHNHFVPRDRALISCLVLCAMLTAPCVGLCSGWLSSAGERMACCVDKAQDEADACCASRESRENSDTATSSPAAAPPALEVVVLEMSATAPLLDPAAFNLDLHDPLTSDSDRHVLLSVFLI